VAGAGSGRGNGTLGWALCAGLILLGACAQPERPNQVISPPADTAAAAPGKPDRDFNGGRGDWMNQHTNDRRYAPWNYAYWSQSNPNMRLRIRIGLVSF
jgi:hypothetical protein